MRHFLYSLTSKVLFLATVIVFNAAGVQATTVYLVTVPEVREATTFCASVSLDSVNDLYGAAFDVIYDPLLLEVVDTDPAIPGLQPDIAEGILLNKNSTETTYMAAALEDSVPGKLVVGITRSGVVSGVTGSASDIASVCFKALQVGDTALIFDKNGLKDSAGANITVASWTGANVTIIPLELGDVNGDGLVDLNDANLVLEILAGKTPAEPLYKSADVNGDNKIGIEEVLYIMQKAAGQRTP